MARYDRIAPLPSPSREAAFPAWPALCDLEADERDAELGRRARLRFLALRPVRRLLHVGIDRVPADSFDRQVEGVREELGHLPARDRERSRIARFLHQIRSRTPLALTTATLNLGEVLEAAEHYHGASEYYHTALELASAYGLTPEQVVAHRLLGRVLRKTGRIEEAEREYRTAAGFADQLEDREQWARSLDGLGQTLCGRKHYEEARRLYREILQRGREFEDPSLISIALVGLCLTEVDAGDFEQAIEYGWAAFDQAHVGEQRNAVLRGLGNAFLGAGLYPTAERCHRIVAERSSAAFTRVQALLDLARVAAHAGRTDLARERLREAVGIASHLGFRELLTRADELLTGMERDAADDSVADSMAPSPSEGTLRIAAEIEALDEALVPASS